MTRRPRPLLFGLCLAASTMSARPPPAEPTLRCTLGAPAEVTSGDPVPLRLTLANPGGRGVNVLVWGTPFEGWRAPFVTVRRDGAALPYRGPSVKRADPGRDEYLRIPAGGRRSATVDLGAAFDLSHPGRYHVEAQLVLHDVVAGRDAVVPRPRERHTPARLACNAVEVVVRPARP